MGERWMTAKGKVSRIRIVEAANNLFYTKGYNQTSIADIAASLGITKGNLHYHFKSKDELLEAVVMYRMGNIAKQFEQWDQQFSDPKSKLHRFVKMLLNEKTNIVRYGCPMGSLNVELGKNQLALQTKAREMFDLNQSWLERTFKQLDKKNSNIRSKHLLTMAQGAALLSYVYSDEKILMDECKAMEEWIESL